MSNSNYIEKSIHRFMGFSYVSIGLKEYDIKEIPTDVVMRDFVFDMLSLSLHKDPVKIEEWLCEMHRGFTKYLSNQIDKAKKGKRRTRSLTIGQMNFITKIPRTKTYLAVHIKYGHPSNVGEKQILYVDIRNLRNLSLDHKKMETNMIERQLLHLGGKSRSDNKQ